MSFICKIASISEMNKKWDYEIENATHSKKNWIQWKQDALLYKKSHKQIPYYGILFC